MEIIKATEGQIAKEIMTVLSNYGILPHPFHLRGNRSARCTVN